MHARRFKFGVPMIAQDILFWYRFLQHFRKSDSALLDGNPPDKSAGRSFLGALVFSVPDDIRIKRNPVPGDKHKGAGNACENIKLAAPFMDVYCSRCSVSKEPMEVGGEAVSSHTTSIAWESRSGVSTEAFARGCRSDMMTANSKFADGFIRKLP